MKVAIAQVTGSPDIQGNLIEAKNYIAKAKAAGADFVVFPENFMIDLLGRPTTLKAQVAEAVDGPFVTGLQQAARDNQIYVVGGILEKDPNDSIRAYNTTVFIDRAGNLLQRYRKIHLYDAFTIKESDSIIPGDEPFLAVETEFGKVGVLVCYELRFPEAARQLVLNGADILFIPMAWVAGAMKEEHLEILLRARAIENTAYICSSSKSGNNRCGRSMIIDPMGVIVASAGEEETLLVAEIDRDRIRRVREKLPCLGHRRPEFYTH